MFLSPQWLSLEQNRLTAMPTTAQSIRGVLVTFYIGEDQTQRQAYWTAAALSEHPTMMDSVVNTLLQTSISSLSSVHHVTGWFQMSSFRGQRWLYLFSDPLHFWTGGECAFPGTIFNRAPPGVAGEWLSQQLH